MGSFINQPDFATRAQIIVPSDEILPENNLQKAALYIGNAAGELCKVTVVMPKFNGELETITFNNVPRGTFMPICVDYVLATDTTATEIIAYW